MLSFSTSRRTGTYTWFSTSYGSSGQESTEPVNTRPHRHYAPLLPSSTRLSRSVSTEVPQFETSNIWSNGSVTLTLRENHWQTRGAAAMNCWVNTTLRMACESTSGWNGSDRECQLSIVRGVIVISWVCRCFFLFLLLLFVFFV